MIFSMVTPNVRVSVICGTWLAEGYRDWWNKSLKLNLDAILKEICYTGTNQEIDSLNCTKS